MISVICKSIVCFNNVVGNVVCVCVCLPSSSSYIQMMWMMGAWVYIYLSFLQSNRDNPVGGVGCWFCGHCSVDRALLVGPGTENRTGSSLFIDYHQIIRIAFRAPENTPFP